MKKPYSFALSSTLIFSLSVASNAQPLEVDWLYFSSQGSWIERTESIISEQTNLKLPVENLTADQFWWHSKNPNTHIAWAQPDPLGLPEKGTPVEIASEPGLWLVQNVSESHLVLQQGKSIRYWPQSQWHLLKWTSAMDYGMSLTVNQSVKQKNDLFYAWRTPELSAQVRYRLDESSKPAQLYQELIVSNLTGSDYSAPGYSFAQVAQQPMFAMRAMSLESSDSAMSAPQASQSQGVPTLISDQPITIAADSHVWLPVSETALSSVKRNYQLQWDTRSQGLQKAQTTVALTAKDSLPDIAGPIKMGVFDHQIALLESQYQPTNKKEAVLQLGQSALVTMNSKMVREGQWQLSVSNRSLENATIELMINHWNGKTSQQVPMTVRVDAQSIKVVELEQGAGGLIKIAK